MAVLFLHSFSHKLCLILFGHTAIMFQYRWILRSTRGDVIMVHIVPISPPLFFRPPKFIVWVVSWYFDFCHLRVKNKGAVSHGYSRNHVKTYRQVLFSAIFPQSRLYCREVLSNRPRSFFRFSPNTCLLKALCRCKDLNLASSYACLTNLTHLIPSDVCRQRQMGIFAALKYPRKMWLRIS